MTFKRKGDLTRHMGIHAPKRVLFCGYNGCQWYKPFHRKDKLVDHVISQHKETREDAKQLVSGWAAVELDDPNDRAIDVSATGGSSQPYRANAFASNYPNTIAPHVTSAVPIGWSGLNHLTGYGQKVATSVNTGYYLPQAIQHSGHLTAQPNASATDWQALQVPVFGNSEYFQSGEPSTAQPEHYTLMDKNVLDDEFANLDATWNLGL